MSSHCSGSWRRRRRGWAGSRGWAAFGQWASPLQPVERGSTWPPGWPQATQQAGPGDAPRLHEAGRIPAPLADGRIAAGAAPRAGGVGLAVPRAALAVLVPAQRFLGRRRAGGAADPPLSRARPGFGGRAAGAPRARVGARAARRALSLRAAVPAVHARGRGDAGRARARGPLLGPAGGARRQGAQPGAQEGTQQDRGSRARGLWRRGCVRGREEGGVSW